MARVIGGLTTSHIPAIGNAVPKEQQLVNDPYWKEFFAAYPPARAWLREAKPDVAIVIYNDHGLNFFLDKMPTFSIGAAFKYQNADEGWGIRRSRPSRGIPSSPGTSSTSWWTTNSMSPRARRCSWIMVSRCRCRCSGPAIPTAT